MVHRNPLKKELTMIPDIRCPWKLPYTGWFGRKGKYFARWYYWLLWEKTSCGHASNSEWL